MSTVDSETSEEYFYDSEQSLASEASEDSFNSANEEFFLPYDVRTDVRRFQLIRRVVKGIFVIRDRPLFFPVKCDMAIFFLVNRDFYSSREP